MDRHIKTGLPIYSAGYAKKGNEAMKEFDSVDEILDFAIEREEESIQFYTKLAGQMERPSMRQVFEDFSREENSHKKKLLAIKDRKLLAPSVQKVADLKVSDYMVDVKPSPDIDFQHALILAMEREKAAFKFYSDLAEVTDDAVLRTTLLTIAQEEARHKLRFEVEYDDHFQPEN
ncbi:MAG: ferritin family protein [Thermodesulfobacteriota bacterium]